MSAPYDVPLTATSAGKKSVSVYGAPWATVPCQGLPRAVILPDYSKIVRAEKGDFFQDLP